MLTARPWCFAALEQHTVGDRRLRRALHVSSCSSNVSSCSARQTQVQHRQEQGLSCFLILPTQPSSRIFEWLGVIEMSTAKSSWGGIMEFIRQLRQVGKS